MAIFRDGARKKRLRSTPLRLEPEPAEVKPLIFANFSKSNGRFESVRASPNRRGADAAFISED